ncbi:MAG: zinc ABC transporter substrate-binding protein [Candidatus Doudnabacteria bacterium]|nr:zinc ABC transporter substrate-binding protein [Candidatus Doudnabacteria bacterium]
MPTNPPFYMRAGRRTVAGILVAVVFGAVLWWNFSIRSGNDARQDDAFVVAVSIPPLASIAEQIIQDDGEVVTLLPSGSSPHAYEPQPQDVINAQRANLFVVVGENFDDWVLPFVPEDAVRLDTASSSGIERITLPDGDVAVFSEPHSDESHEDEHAGEGVTHSHGLGFDPHVWLSATNGALIAERYGEVFADYDPEHADLYRERATELASQLRALAGELGEHAEIEQVAFISMHDGWRTFADAQDLFVAGAVEEIPGKVPSPQQLLVLTDAAESGAAQFIATEPQLSAQVATTLACDLGLPTVVLDPLGGEGIEGRETYQDLLRYNVEAVDEGLRKASQPEFNPCSQ